LNAEARGTNALVVALPIARVGGLAAGFVTSAKSGRTVIVRFTAYAVFQAWRGARGRRRYFATYAGDKVPAAASEADGYVDGLRITMAIPIHTSVRIVLTNANCETDN
jgi:hypothetical protein